MILSKLASAGMSLFMGALFVGALYIGTTGEQNRDDPAVIKSRFIRTGCSCVIALSINYALLPVSNFTEFLPMVGITYVGLLPALLVPTLLTAVFFTGPLLSDYLQGWLAPPDFSDLRIVRAVVVAPIAEELVFRACLVPLMLASG